MIFFCGRLDDWFFAGPGEGKAGHNRRVDTVGHLSEYMLGLGIPVYVHLLKIKKRRTGSIFTGGELSEFFSVVDHYKPGSINHTDYRLAREYLLIFRLHYCCGMRNNEVCSLEEDFDFESGIIPVRDGKNQKERLVYIPEDMRKKAMLLMPGRKNCRRRWTGNMRQITAIIMSAMSAGC